MTNIRDEKPITLTSHQSRYSKKKDDKINPLRLKPDYREQRHTGAAMNKTAIQTERIYFVDENMHKLQPTAEGVHRGEKPVRFKGILKRLPYRGDILRSKDENFIVKRVEHELRLSIHATPKIYIVLELVS